MITRLIILAKNAMTSIWIPTMNHRELHRESDYLRWKVDISKSIDVPLAIGVE